MVTVVMTGEGGCRTVVCFFSLFHFFSDGIGLDSETFVFSQRKN